MMPYTEKLLWILDKNGMRRKSEEEYLQNIDFVHSLGLKCDCVGWSSLKLSDPRTDEILAAIDRFCKENGWKARGWYERTYTAEESDWYELVTSDLKDGTCTPDRVYAPSDLGKAMELTDIRAYHEISPSPKDWRREFLVPERFRNVCIRHGILDARFCWVRDKGKYEAEQYFFLYAAQQIPRIAVSRDFHIEDTDRIRAAGGSLPKIASVFSTLQQINLYNCYLAADMPAGGIAYAYVPHTHTYCGRNKILIHKDTVQILLREKALSPCALRPAAIVDTVPGGYILDETQTKPCPSSEYAEQMLLEYQKRKAVPRPVRMVSEKEALKVLRKAKKERKPDFQKALPGKVCIGEADARYVPLESCYRITNGGFLSDEYEFLPFAEAQKQNAAFFKQLEAEELLEGRPDGVVFAKCPDGDAIFLCADQSVIRFSHETPEMINQWPSLAQFIVDAIFDES